MVHLAYSNAQAVHAFSMVVMTTQHAMQNGVDLVGRVKTKWYKMGLKIC